jgi:hypothetical protein
VADLGEIVRQLALVERGTPGIASAHEYAPTVPAPLPAFVNIIDSGEVVAPRLGQGVREATHRIKAVALIALQADLRDAERRARPLITDFIERLDSYKTLNNAADVLSADVVSYEYGPYSYQGSEQPYVGVQFTVAVETVETGVAFGTTG